MSTIESKYCLISTSYLPGFLTFSYYFLFDRIVCVLVSLNYQWGVMLIIMIRNLNLNSIQSWTYLIGFVMRCCSQNQLWNKKNGKKGNLQVPCKIVKWDYWSLCMRLSCGFKIYQHWYAVILMLAKISMLLLKFYHFTPSS